MSNLIDSSKLLANKASMSSYGTFEPFEARLESFSESYDARLKSYESTESTGFFAKAARAVKRALSFIGSLLQWPFSRTRKPSEPVPTLEPKLAIASVQAQLQSKFTIEEREQIIRSIDGFNEFPSDVAEVCLSARFANYIWRDTEYLREDLEEYILTNVQELVNEKNKYEARVAAPIRYLSHGNDDALQESMFEDAQAGIGLSLQDPLRVMYSEEELLAARRDLLETHKKEICADIDQSLIVKYDPNGKLYARLALSTYAQTGKETRGLIWKVGSKTISNLKYIYNDLLRDEQKRLSKTSVDMKRALRDQSLFYSLIKKEQE